METPVLEERISEAADGEKKEKVVCYQCEEEIIGKPFIGPGGGIYCNYEHYRLYLED